MIDPLLFLCARAEGHPVVYARIGQHAATYKGWDTLPEEAERHGVAPLLYTHCRVAGIALPPLTQKLLQGLYVRHRQANVLRKQTLQEILSAYQKAGIEALVLKGAALAHTVYPDPALRPMRDLDLLVPEREALRAQRLLADLGFDAPATAAYLPADHHHLPAAKRKVGGMTLSIEVHHRLLLDQHHHKPIPFEDLVGSARTFDLDGITAYTLGHEAMLWHIYQHAFGVPNIAQPLRAIWVADLVSLVEKFGGEIDWEKVKRDYPQVWHILPLLHSLTPWSESLLTKLPLAPDHLPHGAGKEFQGWPRFAVAAQKEKGIGRIIWDTFWPPDWWLCLYYGTASDAASLAWNHSIRHPFHILGWVIQYLRESTSRSKSKLEAIKDGTQSNK